jgi:hypothetical protein
MFWFQKYKTTITCGARFARAEGVVFRTAINNFTFDGSTKDAMQQAVRDAPIAFMAATAQAQLKPPRLSAGRLRHRARHGGLPTLAEAELCLHRRRRHAEFGRIIEGRP